jgi:hypothetical protein
MNAYVGIGRDYNIGFGGYPPVIMRHFSVAKYYNRNDLDYWAAFIHLNKLCSITGKTFDKDVANPNLELGAMYCPGDDDLRQNISFGMGYGMSPAWRLDELAGDRLKPARRLFPFIKYSIVTQDVGLSAAHYHGQTKTAILASIPDLYINNDTVLRLDVEEIDSIKEISIRGILPSYKPHIGFFLNTYRTVPIYGYALPPQDEFCHYIDEFHGWLGNDFHLCYVGNSGKKLILDRDADDFRRELKQNRHIVIVKYPESLRQKVSDIPALIKDNSFGFAVFAHP